MTRQRITDEHAMALLDGRVPEDRDDLQQVAAVIGTLRLASFEAPPQPSAALAARLDMDRLAWVPATHGSATPACDAERKIVLARRPARARMKRALGWFTGLGVAAQLALGAGAVGASAAGIGVAGALPPAAQQMFDIIVATMAEAEELLPGSAARDSEGGEVADDARTGAQSTAGEGSRPNATDLNRTDSKGTEPKGTGAGNSDEGPGIEVPAGAPSGPGISGSDGTGRGNSVAHAPGNHGNAAHPARPANGHGRGAGEASGPASKPDEASGHGESDAGKPASAGKTDDSSRASSSPGDASDAVAGDPVASGGNSVGVAQKIPENSSPKPAPFGAAGR